MISKKYFTKNKLEQEIEDYSESGDLITVPELIDSPSRIVGLYGEIEGRKCAGLIAMLYHMKETGKVLIPEDPAVPEGPSKIHIEPIEFIISTGGGFIADMFSVYDVMRDIKKQCDIATFGLGCVMSAGVLLLAAGTPGKRKVGKNCRLMIHSVAGGNSGPLHDLQNSYKETSILQDAYIEELSLLSQGKLTKKKIKSIFKKKIDTYFDAKQALAWGLVDEIV